jgi:hypothetical protein
MQPPDIRIIKLGGEIGLFRVLDPKALAFVDDELIVQ